MGEDVEEVGAPCITGGNVSGAATVENSMMVPQEIKGTLAIIFIHRQFGKILIIRSPFALLSDSKNMYEYIHSFLTIFSRKYNIEL